MRGLYDYAATCDTELTFKEGDILTVTEQVKFPIVWLLFPFINCSPALFLEKDSFIPLGVFVRPYLSLRMIVVGGMLN